MNQREKQDINNNDLRQITGTHQGEEDAIDTKARQGVEADKATNGLLSSSQLQSAETGSVPKTAPTDTPESKALDTVGSGFTPGDKARSRFSSFTSKITRKKLIGGGVAGSIVVMVIAIFSIVSGPSQFIHISQLLQSFHFGNNDRFMESRNNNIITHLRNYATGDRHRNNLGSRSNRIADKFEQKLLDVGIEPIYENAGRKTGRIQYIKIDPTTSQGKKVLTEARKAGIDIPEAVDGKHLLSLRGSGGTARARMLLRSSLDALDMGKLSSAMSKRLLIKRAGVDFHPLKNIAREQGQDALDYYRARREERAKNRAQGTDDIKITAPDTEDILDEDGTTRVDPSAQQAANEANQVVQELEAIDIADVDAPAQLAKIKNSLLVKGAGSATAVVGVMCTARSLGQQAENVQYAKIILPMLRIGMEFVTIGAQVMSGKGVNNDELGAVAGDLYDTSKNIPPESRSFFNAASWQAEEGKPQTGPDLPEAIRPANVEQEPVWLSTLNAVPGLSTACGISDLFSGLPIIKNVSEAASSVVSFATAGTLDKLVSLVIDVMAGDVEIINAKGAELGNIANYGTLLAANDSAISMGGRALRLAEVFTLDTARKQEDQQQLRHKSFFTRIFDPHEKGSLVATTVLENPSLARPTTAVASFLQTPLTVFSNLGSMGSSFFSGHLQAQTATYNYGIDEYGFSQEEMDNPAYEDPFANASIVEPRLAYLNSEYGSCFGTTIGSDGRINTQETVKYSATKKCDTPKAGDTELLTRYRFYIADTIAMATLACYELNEACNEIGFGSAAPAATPTPSEVVAGDTTTIPCDPRTIDKGPAVGFKNKQPINIRLCEVPNMPGAIVNSQISGAVFDMAQAAQTAGVNLAASEAFRTKEQQDYFWGCYQTKSCNEGRLAAEPGTSNHQMGLAIDFNCNGGSMQYGNVCYDWLEANARQYGFIGNVAGEPWHWSTTGN